MQNSAHKIVTSPGLGAGPDDDITFDIAPGLVTLDPNRLAEAESYRALRTHIMARHVEDGKRALAVCSATQGVGCTFVAANLAIALSQVGVKTLLIDANMRSPGLDSLFIPSRPVLGLQQALSGDPTHYMDHIHPDVLPDLSLMFSGGTPANAQELLATQRFTDVMNFCLRDYEMTVLDTPPANICSDGIRVASVVGYSLIVVRANRSLVNDIRTLIAQLEADRARVVGTVLTEI